MGDPVIRPPQACEQCGGGTLVREEGSLGSWWRRRAVRLVLYVCQDCARAHVYVGTDPAPTSPAFPDGAQL